VLIFVISPKPFVCRGPADIYAGANALKEFFGNSHITVIYLSVLLAKCRTELQPYDQCNRVGLLISNSICHLRSNVIENYLT